MKDRINKQVIAIVGTACVCAIAIVGAIVTVKNTNSLRNDEKEVAVIESQKVDDSVADEKEHTSIIDEEVPDLITDDGNEDEDKNNPEQGSNIEEFGENEVVKCTRQILTDPQTQVAVMSVLVPEGWSATCNVDWSFIDEYSPARAYVELQSPNGDIDIYYMSHMRFVQASDDTYIGRYNRNYMKMRTELDYMDAKSYTNHLLESAGIVMNSSVQTDINSRGEQKLRELAYSRGSNLENILKQAREGTVQTPGMDMYVEFSDYDAQVYVQNGWANQGGADFYVETICEEMMFELTSITTLTAPTETLKFEYPEKYWEPYLFTISSFADEQAYKDNFDMYRFLVSNMILCADFEYLNRMLGSQYVAKAIQANIEVSNYAHEVMMQYQQETMQQEDAWVQNFSDYIYDQTTYTMSDGSDVTVPTSADYVYSDGNEVIWSNSAFYDPGPGYDQIN